MRAGQRSASEGDRFAELDLLVLEAISYHGHQSTEQLEFLAAVDGFPVEFVACRCNRASAEGWIELFEDRLAAMTSWRIAK